MRKLNSNELACVSGGFMIDGSSDYSYGGGWELGGAWDMDIPFAAGSGGSYDLGSVTVIGRAESSSSSPFSGYDAVLGSGLTRAAGTAGAAFGEGIALGFGAGSWLGPAGGVIGAFIGAGIAYWIIRKN